MYRLLSLCPLNSKSDRVYANELNSNVSWPENVTSRLLLLRQAVCSEAFKFTACVFSESVISQCPLRGCNAWRWYQRRDMFENRTEIARNIGFTPTAFISWRYFLISFKPTESTVSSLQILTWLCWSKCNVYTMCRQTQLSTRWYANLLNVNLNYMFRPQSLAIIRLYKRKL